MKYSFKEIVDSLPKKKNGRSSLWVRCLVRKISFPFTYLFINTGWTANMVSVLSWGVILIGAVLLSINNFWCMLSGVVLTNFWLVLDCVDGNIARCKKQKTFMGDFYDAIAGYGPFAFTTIGLGMAAYHTSFLVERIGENVRFYFILLAAVGAMTNLYTRIIHQKYLTCFFVAKKELGELDDITKISVYCYGLDIENSELLTACSVNGEYYVIKNHLLTISDDGEINGLVTLAHNLIGKLVIDINLFTVYFGNTVAYHKTAILG